MGRTKNKTLFGILMSSILIGGGLQTYISIRALHPHSLVYRDVNNDGVDDKIIEKPVRKEGFLWMEYDSLKEKVLYGVEINGKIIYLPKDEFEQRK